ncbi:MAG: hypothetical protein QOG53_2332 [Frankiales bacterium]|nr:hypothetical protein [Frankiales bacterium]
MQRLGGYRAALVLLVSATLAGTFIPLTAARAATTGPALTIDVGANRHPISPDIYGMNYTDAALATELGLTTDRWGGNSTTRYNYVTNTHNTGSDYYYENIGHAASDSLDTFVAGDLAHATKPVVTVPMLGYVAKSSPSAHPFACGFKVTAYGPQQSTDSWDSDCGNGVHTNGTPITGNDPLDTSVAAGPAFVQNMVAHLVTQHGSAAAGGVATYELDNEPALWNSTHRDVHPAAVTYNELWTKSRDTAIAIKNADAGAQVAGPGDWGWCAYFFSPADPGGCSDGPDRQAHGGKDIAPWLLAQFKAYEQANGKRLLDVFDQHYYPQASGVALSSAGSTQTQALRLRSTRSLWDPTYTDESWTNDLGLGPVKLITRMRQWVADNYPGTKLSISEYNWGGHESVNGALAQADVLGIFGREAVDRALLWSPPTSGQPAAFAFRMFRNYDGAGARFGETSVKATSADQDKLAVYAAQRTSDNALTAVVINKTASDFTSSLALTGSTGASAQVFTYTGADTAHIVHAADAPVSGGALSRTYPANSITVLVLPAGTAAQATSLTITPSTTSTTYGTDVSFAGTLNAAGTGLTGKPVTLQANRAGTSTWQNMATVTSGANGALQQTVHPGWSASWRWSYAGSTDYAPSVSPSRTLLVRELITTNVSKTSISAGQTVSFTGKIYPAHPGAPLQLQKRDPAGVWRKVGQVATSSTGTYSMSYRPVGAGTQAYRMYWTGDVDHIANSGPVKYVTVR